MPEKNIFNSLWGLIRHTAAVFMSPLTPLYVKVLLAAGLLYILSPYDLIPEWLPIIGIMDDFALAALLIAWTSRFRTGENSG
ncbi:MAG: DUF1232 domain-containing protein [Desulfobulbaceae bacterium]|nr:DUF1232 domain-containing protein [Desulfobulbaceae bacterium]